MGTYMHFIMMNHEYIEMAASLSTIYDINRELHGELLLAAGDDKIRAELEKILTGLEYINDKVCDSFRRNEMVWTLLDQVVDKINQIKKSILKKSMNKEQNYNPKTSEDDKIDFDNISKFKSTLTKSLKKKTLAKSLKTLTKGLRKKNKIVKSKKTKPVDIIENKNDDGVTPSWKVMKSSSTMKRASVPCTFCGKVFSNLSNKERHERISCLKADKEKIEEKKFKCNINNCDRQFSKNGYFRKHQINEHR